MKNRRRRAFFTLQNVNISNVKAVFFKYSFLLITFKHVFTPTVPNGAFVPIYTTLHTAF